MKQLPPLIFKKEYYRHVRKEIERILNEVFYRELFKIASVERPKLNSEEDELYKALATGMVYHENGQIKGNLSGRIGKVIRKLGGKYNRKSKTYSLKELPVKYQLAQGMADSYSKELRDNVNSYLQKASTKDIDKISEIPDAYIETINEMDQGLQETMGKIAIEAKLTEGQRNEIAAEWGHNLDLYIKKWASENIVKLRKEVQGTILEGGRAEQIQMVIMKNYGVSRRKAEFLARQETSLLMSKFREVRYRQLGIRRYRWSTSGDERVRDDHRVLDKKIFDFSSPPVVDRTNGRRAHPGEDFGCRCIAIPVIDNE